MVSASMHVVGDEPFSECRSARCSSALEDTYVTRRIISRLVDDPGEVPARRVREAREVVGGEQQEVEPIPDAAFVVPAQGEQSRWSAAGDVPFHVAQVFRDPRAGDPGAADDPAAAFRDLPGVAEE